VVDYLPIPLDIGEVKVPGTYSLSSLSTVLNALYVAGGPTKLGTFREIKLVRQDQIVASLDIYEYLLNGTQKGNLKLQDQDVLLVGPYKNLVTVEGAVKRPGIYELTQGQTLSDLIGYFGGFTSKAYTSLLEWNSKRSKGSCIGPSRHFFNEIWRPIGHSGSIGYLRKQNFY